MVASDRISAFDFVLDTTIPDKGEILTRMSLWWFDQLADLVPNHVLVDRRARPRSRGRAVVCERLDDVPRRVRRPRLPHRLGAARLPRAPARCAASPLPAGLEDGSRLPEPIFTPATKAALGEHDENVSYDAVVGDGRRPRPRPQLRDLTLRGLRRAPRRSPASAASSWPTPSSSSGARPDGTDRCSADEVLTPDSSRFWPADEWQPGRAQPSYDKQIVRDWLLSPASGWDRASGEPPPPLPDEVVERDPRALRRGLRTADRETFAG